MRVRFPQKALSLSLNNGGGGGQFAYYNGGGYEGDINFKNGGGYEGNINFKKSGGGGEFAYYNGDHNYNGGHVGAEECTGGSGREGARPSFCMLHRTAMKQ